MVVRTQSKGRGVSGLLLKAADVRRHIPGNTAAIELQLGELWIHCPLSPEFWNGRPEICDRRLGEWLEFKVIRTRSCRVPVVLELTPIGINSFRLEIPPGCDGSACNLARDERVACTSFVSPSANPVLETPGPSNPAVASTPD